MKAPHHWTNKGLISTALLPLSWLYLLAGFCLSRLTKPYHARLPVICVGNITSGGTGKTPITAYLANLAKERGLRPVILSRGYGGHITTPTRVDPATHSATDCGDEPLLLATYAPVIIARNRGKGAEFIEAQNCFDVIIMDDGMQNPQLYKDHVICVFDGAIGYQNGRIFPAGPLRNSVATGCDNADIIIINGDDETKLRAAFPDKIMLSSSLTPSGTPPHLTKAQAKSPLFAFAGIGRPERFFETLAQQGYYLAQTKSFGDHHHYTPQEIAALIEGAKALSASLITTQKDWVRLPFAIRKHIAYLPVEAHICETQTAHLAALLPVKAL